VLHNFTYFTTVKKAIPYLFILILLIVALFVRQYRERQYKASEQSDQQESNKSKTNSSSESNLDFFRDPETEYYFTKHARCRMNCRRITQKEVKEIVRKAEVNYNKSELDAPKGPTYALEGYTSKDRQHVRIIVAPKQRHLSIVTVIDLDKDWECPSCK
jgi:Domain of unknown function (DUF4258)